METRGGAQSDVCLAVFGPTPPQTNISFSALLPRDLMSDGSNLWEFVHCAICYTFWSDPPIVPFYATGCGHIICNDHLSVFRRVLEDIRLGLDTLTL